MKYFFHAGCIIMIPVSQSEYDDYDRLVQLCDALVMPTASAF